jgi:hypothetical protein
MLPVYKAISFQRIIEKGGRTKPWLVLVDTGTDVKPYVMKLFTTDHINKRDAVCGEVLGNFLAKEFELPVPQAALIETDGAFTSTINDFDALETFDQRDDRIKFGCELLNGYNQLQSGAFDSGQFKRMIRIGSLFAFDNLIRNRDRNNSKTNLLVRRNKAVLIDHELGFEIEPNTIDEFRNFQWNPAFYQYHLAYRFIKNSWKETKIHYFDEFGECLKYLNVNKLDSYFKQLVNYGFSPAKHSVIRDYLTEIKANSSNFVNMLKGIIG